MATPTTSLTAVVGETVYVKSFQADAYGVGSNTKVVWSTSDSGKAIVQNVVGTNNAVIYCITTGTPTITATMGSITSTFSLTINASSIPGDGYSLSVGTNSMFQAINKTIQTKV